VNTQRPLDGIASIKVKLAVLVAASIVVAALVSEIGDRAGVPVWLTVPVTVTAALAVTQWLARGMTAPLRQMTAAAGAMATGDYTQRVPSTSADEVGRLAAAFNTMAADLATADQQRRQLVATVSHELRTPLTAQRALLENLVDGVVRPDDTVLRSALAQAERLSALVEDLLDLSRLDGGRGRLSLKRIQVRPLIDRCVAEAKVVGRSVRHVVAVPDSLVVTADEDRLAQVLANLLDNAGRHSPPGGLVSVRAGVLAGGRWFLEVADEGPGIAGDQTDRVFDRFGTGDDSGGGTGIGLAIASWVCELHDGSISVLPPAPGEAGARLRAVLPVEPRPHQRPTISPTTSPEEQTVSSPAVPATPTPPPAATALPAGVPPPFVDTLFGDLWPEAGLSPRISLLLGSIGVGVLAAAILPFRNVGLALLLVLVVAGVLVLRVATFRSRPWTILSAALALGLASFTVLRAAEWLAVLAIAAIVLLGATALTGAKGFLSFLGGVVAWPLAGLRGLPLLGRTVAATSRVSVLWPIVRTVAISVVALVLFGGLFASGDAVFGSWAQAVIPDLEWDSLVARFFVGFVVGGVVLAATYLAINPPRVDRLAAPPARPVTRLWEWVVPVGVVVGVFLAFVVAQAAALFGGHDYVQRTTGLTYAAYVHQGFGQLTVATVLTLVTIALAVRKAPTATARERLVLRLVLGTLCALTLVVVASALHRMDLYQQAYGFTVLRVLVDGFELWLGLLVVMVALAGIRLSGAWLPRAALLSAVVFLLVGGLANPEAWVAQRNIDRYHATGKLDTAYLVTLGPDAAPTIAAGLPADVASCLLRSKPPMTDDLLGWNFGRARVTDLVEGLPPVSDPVECTTWLHTDYER
jgi:signal transduction histidine kinase